MVFGLWVPFGDTRQPPWLLDLCVNFSMYVRVVSYDFSKYYLDVRLNENMFKPKALSNCYCMPTVLTSFLICGWLFLWVWYILCSGVDDMQMCELSLEETGLSRKRGAEIMGEEFEREWRKNNGNSYVLGHKTSLTSQYLRDKLNITSWRLMWRNVVTSFMMWHLMLGNFHRWL